MKFIDTSAHPMTMEQNFEQRTLTSRGFETIDDKFATDLQEFRGSVMDAFEDFDALHGKHPWMFFRLDIERDPTAPNGLTGQRDVVITLDLAHDQEVDDTPHIRIFVLEHLADGLCITEEFEVNCQDNVQYSMDAIGPEDDTTQTNKRHSGKTTGVLFSCYGDDDVEFHNRQLFTPMVGIDIEDLPFVAPYGFSDDRIDRQYALDKADEIIDAIHAQLPVYRSTQD